MRGGLGNQLFIFAAAYAQARRLEAPLLLDVCDFTEQNIRNFELGNLDFSASPIPISVTNSSQGGSLSSSMVGRLARRWILKNRYFQDNPGRFDAAINQIVPGTRLTGYFQSFRYFSEYDAEIMAFLESSSSFKLRAKSSKSIAMQVRLGDYLSPKNLPLYGLCSERYFVEGSAILERLLNVYNRKIYTDSPEQLTLKYPNLVTAASTTISQGSKSPMDELFKMSAHSGAVVSNSSFGWWASYVGKYYDQNFEVVAPRPWTLSLENSIDLLPLGWLTLDNR